MIMTTKMMTMVDMVIMTMVTVMTKLLPYSLCFCCVSEVWARGSVVHLNGAPSLLVLMAPQIRESQFRFRNIASASSSSKPCALNCNIGAQRITNTILGGSLLYLQYNGPQNLILLMKALTFTPIIIIV